MKNYPKGFFFLILLLMASILFLTTIAEGARIKLRVNVENANIRLKPTIESTIISKAPLGAILESEEKVGNWYKVNLPPDESGFVVSGYIHESIVEVVEEIEEISAKESVEEKKISKVEKPTKEKEEEKGEVAWIISKESKDKRKEEKKEEIPKKTKKLGITGKGIKIGLNLANVTGDDIEINWENKMGFCAGGFMTFNLSNMFAIQPEAFFTMKGYKSDQEWNFYKLTITYLEIPVLAKILILTEGTIKPNIFAGPSLGIRISGEEDMKSTDFGLIFGGGIDFAFGTGNFLVDFRYSMGLSSIYENEDVKNTVISIMVGYYF